MLDGLRIMSKHPFGRAILAAFAGLIVVGFGFFGIRDVFTNFRANQLATVGGAEIGVMDYRSAYQNELQRLQRQARRAVTNEEARAIGLDRQVLARLLTGAALDQEAEKLGLSVSDADLAKGVKAEKIFAGPGGGFDQTRFDELLRDNGYTEASYLREQRATTLRQQIGAAINDGFKIPQVTLEAINRFNGETRKADYFILPPPDSSALPAPPDDEIKAFYDLRQDSYRSPEYRKATVLILSPAELAKTLTVSDDEAKKIYDRDAAAKYSTPEKRAVAQLTFQSQEVADKARSRIAKGETFAALAADKEAGGVLADLGVTTKAAIFDKAVAEAAFHDPVAGVAGPVKGQFGFVLANVTQIQPGATRGFDEVKDEIKSGIAQARAKTEAQKLHDKIEDLRASGKTLTQAAQEAGLKVETYVADAAGAGKDGPIAALAGAPELVKAMFASDVGVDNDSVARKDGGYAWFEIASVEKSRLAPLDEIKDRVAKEVRDGLAQKALAAKANDLAKQIDAGADLAALAKANGVAVQQAAGVRRSGGPGLGEPVVAEIFALPVGAAGVALAGQGGRAVLKVTDSATPPLDVKDPGLVKALPQLEASMADDLLVEYVAGLQNELGVRINQTALRAAQGGEQ